VLGVSGGFKSRSPVTEAKLKNLARPEKVDWFKLKTLLFVGSRYSFA
jgi:hypothetical protein